MNPFLTPNKKMQKVKQMAEKAAKTDTALLIVGEKGADRDFCAKWIHENGARSEFLFAKLSEEDITSGVRLADYLKNVEKGTLLVDEVSKLSLEQQKELAELLSGGEYSFRLIATTTRLLESLVKKGWFLEELYYMLCVMQIKLPVLADGRGDKSGSGESLHDELFSIALELLQSAKHRETYMVHEEYKKLVFPPLLKAVLQNTNNNKTHAAELLGINRNTFKKMIREFEISE
jgi:DNA-binding NtrC family response regulator